MILILVLIPLTICGKLQAGRPLDGTFKAGTILVAVLVSGLIAGKLQARRPLDGTFKAGTILVAVLVSGLITGKLQARRPLDGAFKAGTIFVTVLVSGLIAGDCHTGTTEEYGNNHETFSKHCEPPWILVNRKNMRSRISHYLFLAFASPPLQTN